MYPLQLAVTVTARVLDFIGLICYKYASEHPEHNLKSVPGYFVLLEHMTYSQRLHCSLLPGITFHIMDYTSPRMMVK